MTNFLLILGLWSTITENYLERTIEDHVDVLEKNTEIINGVEDRSIYIFWDFHGPRGLVDIAMPSYMGAIKLEVTEGGWGYLYYFDRHENCHRLIKFDEYIETKYTGQNRVYLESELYNAHISALDIPYTYPRKLTPSLKFLRLKRVKPLGNPSIP